MRDAGQDGVPDSAALMRMATNYLARYAASSHRVRQVLERRIQRVCRLRGIERPDEGALAAALDETMARLQALGLIDDSAFASARTRALQRKGLPERRVRMELRSQGLSTASLDDEETVVDDDAQAHRYAARKRLGPYRTGERHPFRDKDLRSMLRAGFSFGTAVAAIDAEPQET